MPDNGNNSASPTLTPPVSQPASQGLPPWLNPRLNPPQSGVFCETPSGFIKLPSLGTHLDSLVRDFCHEATLDYLAKRKLEIVFPFHPNVLGRSIISHDGFSFKTPTFLHLGKLDAAAIFSAKPALPIGNSSLTGAGLSLEYHVSPRFQISAAGSFGQTSTDLYDRKIDTRQDIGVTFIFKGKF